MAVAPASVAHAMGVRPGDVLLQVNGHRLRDVLDVQFYAADETLDILLRREGKEIRLQGERLYGVPLGLDFSAPTFDGLRQCQNACDFCFVSQMPPGLRRSLYIRDDDYRYSVLYGSFVTLTRLRREDWDRLAEQRLSPLYVSVHATELSLRRQLLGREDIPDILSQLDDLAELGIEVHTQVVLIPGINDGPHLARTVADLAERFPAVQSIGIVPIGLTRHHRGGCRLHTPLEARGVVDLVTSWQSVYRAGSGRCQVYLADEWYLLAGLEVPAAEMYDGYPQVENGIGLVRQFLDDADGVDPGAPQSAADSYTLACGTLIAPLMVALARRLSSQSGTRVDVVPVMNRLFGETVTVSGLLSGEDVIATLTARDVGEVVLLPATMFAQYAAQGRRWTSRREQHPVGSRQASVARTLDDMTAQDLVSRLGRPVVVASYLSEVWGCAAPQSTARKAQARRE